MSALRGTAARSLRQMNDNLITLSMSYKLAREAKVKGHREDWITLDYTSGMYHDMVGLFSSVSAYMQATEKFTPAEMDRIMTMPSAELRTTTEFDEVLSDSPTGCNCGWGGVHDSDNPRCAANEKVGAARAE